MEGMGWSAGVCGERLARPTGRIGLREEDRSRRRLVRRGRGRSFRYDQGDRGGEEGAVRAWGVCGARDEIGDGAGAGLGGAALGGAAEGRASPLKG